MGKKFGLAVALLSLICLISSSVMAVPGVINYQGKLTNTSDCVLTGTYQIIFRLYAGGTLKWKEEQTVAVDQGLFNVKLGSEEIFPVGLFENDNLDLEMVIQNPDTGLWEPLSPRQKITSVAYAIKADYAATATNASHATKADTATNADSATTADTAINASHAALADSATNATNANHASTADSATSATNADHAATAGDADTVDGKHASELGSEDGYSLDAVDGEPVDAVYVDNAGNVGIGTKNPVSKLHIEDGGITVHDDTGWASLLIQSDFVVPGQGPIGGSIMLKANGNSVDKYMEINLDGRGNGANFFTNSDEGFIFGIGPDDNHGHNAMRISQTTANVWVAGNVSAASFTDRTPYPKDLKTAYNAVFSMQRLPDEEYDENNTDKQLDHSKLHKFIKSSDDGHRDLSATVSAQNEVIKDLVKQIEILKARIQELEGNL